MANLQNTIDSQLPRHVVQDYPLFVEFLKAYYEWMGENGQPYYALENHLDWLNFKDSMDDYISFLREEYLFNLPANTAGGLELFLRNSKQFHLTVGTEQSFKFIFKILFGESAGDVELYFPRKDILKVSDSSWTAAQSVMLITDSGNSSDFLYRVIKQTKEVFPGVFRYAYAIVQRVLNRYAGRYKVTELYLRDIQGEFELGYPVTVENRSEWIVPTGNIIEIDSKGSQYYLDDKVSFSGPTFFTKEIEASVGDKVDTQISGVFTEVELGVEIDGVPVTDFVYDGRYISHISIVPGSNIKIKFPVFRGYLAIGKIGDLGELEEVKVYDSPIGLTQDHDLTITSSAGSGFVGKIRPALLREIDGYFVDDKGHLDSTKVIQDSNYYQEFSYVIRSSLDIDKYRDIVLKLLHPAGMKMFGKVDILELVKLFIRNIYDEVYIPERSVIMDLSSASLYTTYGYIDRFKHNLKDTIWKTFYFKDIKVSDISKDKTDRSYNIQDVIIEVV